MKGRRTLFSSLSPHWRTPKALYKELDREFFFTLDPCPNGALDGLTRSWKGHRVYCNPPYGRTVGAWLEKAKEAKLAVYLLPARTDTIWFHRYAFHATEIRFLKGRLRFSEYTTGAPFPSVLLIYRKHTRVKS